MGNVTLTTLRRQREAVERAIKRAREYRADEDAELLQSIAVLIDHLHDAANQRSKTMPLSKEHKELLRKSTASLEEAAADIDSVHSELQEAFDDLSPSVQEASKGECLTEVIEDLEALSDSITQITDTLYGLTEPQPRKSP
jgi:chromosome segregation ATPase